MSDAASPSPSVVVVGGGIAGISCARVLDAAGIAPVVLDRGARIGGRMAVRTEDLGGVPHAVDVGASYLTTRDAGFADVACSWQERGLARPWTDTVAVLGSDAAGGAPLPRWAATHGLRSLVEDLAAGLDVRSWHEVEDVGVLEDGRPHVDGEAADAVVLAMPDPQAADVLPEALGFELGLSTDWNPVISVWAGWSHRWWPKLPAVFVHDSAVLSWIADDGDRRGDGAPVLVAHVTPELSGRHLDVPEEVVPAALAELARLLGEGDVPEPLFARAKRWSLASPIRPHRRPFGVLDLPAGTIGVCGDAWGPKPRVEQAWCSGRDLGAELVRRLAPAAVGA
ncbi:MAG: FAD-dependent oxidoreductase [Kineosporiaceae bacterium]